MGDFEIKKMRRLGRYIEYARSVYLYAGSYPNWKAQKEFREIIEEHPLGEYRQDLVRSGAPG